MLPERVGRWLVAGRTNGPPQGCIEAETRIDEESADPVLHVRAAEENILITQNGTAPVGITITDASGRLVGSGTVPAKGTLSVRMNERSSGIYLVRPASGVAQRVMLL